MRRREQPRTVEPLRPEEVERLTAPHIWIEDWITLVDRCDPAHPDAAADGLAALATRRAEEAVVRGCILGDLPGETYLRAREQRLTPRWRDREGFLLLWHERRWNTSGRPVVTP